MDDNNHESESLASSSLVLRGIPRTFNCNPKIKVDLLKTEYPIIRSVATSSFQYRLWCRNGTNPIS